MWCYNPNSNLTTQVLNTNLLLGRRIVCKKNKINDVGMTLVQISIQFLLTSVPCSVGVPAKNIPIGFCQDNSVMLVVAFFVEYTRFPAVFRCLIAPYPRQHPVGIQRSEPRIHVIVQVRLLPKDAGSPN